MPVLVGNHFFVALWRSSQVRSSEALAALYLPQSAQGLQHLLELKLTIV